MAKFTLHNEHGDFMSDTAKTLKFAKSKCDRANYKCKCLKHIWLNHLGDFEIINQLNMVKKFTETSKLHLILNIILVTNLKYNILINNENEF